MRHPTLAALALTGALSAPCAHAARIADVQVRGLDEGATANVRNALGLVDAMGREVSARRLAYLVRQADDETREALEPFGYYSPAITVQRSDRDRPERGAAPADEAPVELAPLDGGVDEGAGAPVTVVITVAPGEAVRVRDAAVAIDGPGGRDKYLQRDLAAFEPTTGDIFDHAVYEASKARISRRLAERGYFDADFARRRVEVTRAANAADIDLAWTSGIRYDMGPLAFVQTPPVVHTALLDKLVYWEPGSYWHQGKLDRLRESLQRLDYFAGIDIEPHPDRAQGTQVPVTVTLTPAKRDVYTAGLSYGTESGAGVRLGMERRYVNMRGHKALAQVDYAQQRKTLTLQYRIPAFAWLDGWYTFSAQALDEQTDYIDTRKVEVVASRSGEINDHWTAIASLHALRERWLFNVADDGGGALAPLDYRYASYVYPSLRGEYIDVDNRMEARRGIGATGMLRGVVEGVGSDASFAQLHVTGRWFRGLDADSRLIVRAELGHTYSDAFTNLPPTLRFYAGGDRSIRGYAFREVGPKVDTDAGEYAVGAKNVTTASVEYERYFSAKWGGAVFVDTGSAFDDTPDWRTGVGVGVRWRSPVGPLRVDIARGLDDPDSAFQLYLTLGADL